MRVTFQEFWQLYPRKTAKLAAAREWARLKPNPETCVQIAATLAWQIPLWRDPKYVPHPSTWLHQGRWLDEPVTTSAPGAAAREVWTCPHREHCAHRAMCAHKLLLPDKYPVKP